MILEALVGALLEKLWELVIDKAKGALDISYRDKLRSIISQTLDAYEAKYPLLPNAEKKPFYYSDVTFQYLMGHILFAKPLPQEQLCDALEKDGRFETPNQEQLQNFFSLFQDLVSTSPDLTELFVEENYKLRILEISQSLETLHPKIDALTTSFEKLSSRLITPEHRDWLKKIRSDLLAFKPLTALEHLNELESSMTVLGHIDPSDHAQILLLKGMCFYEQGESKKGEEAYLEAWKRAPAEISCMEKALRVLIDQGNFDAAKKLTDEIFVHQPQNPMAWASKFFLDPRDIQVKLNEVPWQIRAQTTTYRDFQTRLAGFYVHHPTTLSIIFREELENDFSLPEEIDFYNRNYWLLLANLQIGEIVLRYILPPDGVHPMVSRHPKLRQAVQIFEKVLQRLEQTEKSAFMSHYRFWYSYGRYCISGQKVDADEVVRVYETLKEKDEDPYPTLTVFALCQTQQYEKVFDFAEARVKVPPGVLQAKGYAHLFTNEADKARECFKLFLDQTEIFGDVHLMAFLGLQRDFTQDQEVREANWLRFQDKFLSISTKQIAELFTFWDKLSSEERKEQIDIIRTEVASEEKNMQILLVGDSYLKNNNPDDSLDIFKLFVDFQLENAEHHRYIEALAASHRDDTELLSRLEHWRESGFTPNPAFLYREIELLSLVPDWDQIGRVAEEGMKYFPEDISFVLYKIWSLEQSGGDVQPLLNSFIGKEGIPQGRRMNIEQWFSTISIRLLENRGNGNRKFAERSFGPFGRGSRTPPELENRVSTGRDFIFNDQRGSQRVFGMGRDS